MRYDWDRLGNPGTAFVNRAGGWVLTALSAVLWAVSVTGIAVRGDWWIVPLALVATAGTVVQRLAVRNLYGVREERTVVTRNAVFCPEVALPPGFVLPSAALTSPAARGPLRKSAVLPSSWDVSTTLDRGGYSGLWHYEDASGKPGGGADGVIRVIARSADRPLWTEGEPVITSWTVIVRAASPVEGTDLLEQAWSPLRDLMFSPAEAGSGPRYFRLEGGRLAEVPERTQPEVPPPPEWRPDERFIGTLSGFARPGTPARPAAAPKAVAAQPDSGAVRLDPRWEWQLVQAYGMPDRWVKVRCLHTEVVDVPSVTGEVVAQLCLACDTQFPAPRED